MWQYTTRLILRNRTANLIVIIGLTLIMAFFASKVKMSYEMAQMLPETDSTIIKYNHFKEIFGQDGNILFLGIRTPKIAELKTFDAWYKLTEDVKKIPGVKESLSLSKMFELEKNDSLKKFVVSQIFKQKPVDQAELDSLFKKMFNIPFYKNLLYNPIDTATLMFITLDKKSIESTNRFALLDNIKIEVQKFETETGVQVHYSGLPYIRTVTSKKVKDELLLFSVLTLAIACIILLLLYRSIKAVIFPLFIVVLSLVWTFGFIALLGYKITILTGILPPLIIIIAVENCIFLINKYHHEYRLHNNKIKALARSIRRVGAAMVLTNLTTAVGFATFIITQNQLLVEFGYTATLSIIAVFFLSLFLVPIIFSLIGPPTKANMRHLDNRNTAGIIGGLVTIISGHRTKIYWFVAIVIIVGIYGSFQLKTTGNVVDDIPKDESMYQDLLFFEKEFKGVLPFEIMIDTKKKKGAMQMATLKRIDRLQDSLAKYPEFSRPISIVDLVKISKMAYYNNDSAMYSLPENDERAFILSYLPDGMGGKKTVLNSFMDSTMRYARISVQMENIGTNQIGEIKKDLQPKIDSIFNKDKYEVITTGTAVVFLEGTNYLVNNLISSVLVALLIITALMGFLFSSFRMISIAIIPNIIPQIATAAMMGYLGIPIKPSTILIFSIALGISVDNTIQFLSRYRMELKLTNDNIKASVFTAVRETAHSIIYSSLVLILGFSVFMLSSFGGTQSLGKLISFLMIVAMFTNLVLLPSLLLTMDKHLATKAFKEPVWEILDEEVEEEPLATTEEVVADDETEIEKNT